MPFVCIWLVYSQLWVGSINRSILTTVALSSNDTQIISQQREHQNISYRLPPAGFNPFSEDILVCLRNDFHTQLCSSGGDGDWSREWIASNSALSCVVTQTYSPCSLFTSSWPDGQKFILCEWFPGRLPPIWIEMPLSGNTVSCSNLPLHKQRLRQYSWDCPYKAVLPCLSIKTPLYTFCKCGWETTKA